MKRVGSVFARVVLIVIILSAAAVPAGAQSIWIPRDQDRGILLEALHPSLEGVDSEFPTGVLFLGTRIGLGERWALVLELPYAHNEAFVGGGFFLGEAPSSSTIGNPYLGAELAASEDLFVEVGARPPLSEDEEGTAKLLGASADPSRRFAFSQTTFPVYFPYTYDAITGQTLLNLRHVTSEGLLARVRLGPAAVFPTTDGQDTELFALYALQVGYEGRSLRAGGAFSGWSHITHDIGNLGTRTATQLEVHADFGPWAVRPGVELKMPIGVAAGLVPVVLGVSVGASF